MLPGFILKYEDGIYTVVTFSSDVQYDPTREEFTKAYMNSLELLKDGLKTVEIN